MVGIARTTRASSWVSGVVGFGDPAVSAAIVARRVRDPVAVTTASASPPTTKVPANSGSPATTGIEPVSPVRSDASTSRVSVTATDASTGRSIDFPLDPALTPRSGHWANYPMTIARRLARNFSGPLCGADVAFASDLPPAAGLSSSSAMIVAFFLALDAANRLSERPEFQQNVTSLTELAGYMGTVENGQTFGSLVGDLGVGTFGGSEDHTAILCSSPGHVSQYAYCPVRPQRSIPLPPGWVFAVGASGVAAERAGAAMARYNAASRSAAAIAELWRRQTGRDDPHLAAALASGLEATDRLAEIVATTPHDAFVPDALERRLAHFIIENPKILPAAGDALAAADLVAFGRLVDPSQRAAEELLGNQVPETIHLASTARAAGAAAASAFGAGFGGSVWALVEVSAAEQFLSAWAKAYRARFPERSPAAAFFLTAAGPAAFQVC